MRLQLQPVRVANGHDEDGHLVFADGHLVAVLVCLSDEHEEFIGHWYLEAGFGGLDGPHHPVFADLDEAQGWIERRLGDK
jgi:hypothetical protein